MRIKHLNISLIFSLIIFFSSCSRKKDKFLNKKFHSTTTKYNFLFNGNNLYNQGLLAIDKEQKENFWNLIPLEKFKFYTEEEEDRESDFTKAEEKATLAIQKHSMNIQGKEKNPIMDEAYFLLGKSRYFDNRFLPALEAFNYILFKYPTSEYINEIKIWKEKINIRLNQDNFAIDNLKTLLSESNLTDFETSMAQSFIAQAYININELDSAVNYLNLSIKVGGYNIDSPRKKFLLAQLYQDLSVSDSAYKNFSEIVSLKRKTSKEFFINSAVNKAILSDSVEYAVQDLKLLLKDIENKKYSDIIYYNLAMIYLNQKDSEIDKKSNEIDSLVIYYLNKSLGSKSNDKTLLSKTYNYLAQINFDNKKYLNAGLYYDSTLTNLNKKSKQFRKIQKKRDNLNDLIFYEKAILELDSILRLVNMSDIKREEVFNDMIKDINRKKNKKNKNQGNFGIVNPMNPEASNDNSLFYFYNPTAVAFGKNNFKSRWGNRALLDNWRWSIKNQDSNLINPEVDNNDLKSIDLITLESFINSIPSDEKVIDSLNTNLNEAYFRLGSIYKDKFEEYEISIEKFDKLLSNNPDKTLIVPAKYFLYQCFTLLEIDDIAKSYKEDIISNHKESKYAKKLLEGKLTQNSGITPEQIYESIYLAFINGEYVKVIDETEKIIQNFEDDILISKFELLRATAIAKVFGFSEYKKSLNDIMLNHSSTLEAKQAEYLISQVLPKITKPSFVNNRISDDYKIIFLFDNKLESEIQNKIKNLNQYLNQSNPLELTISFDLYDNKMDFVVIHGLKSYDGSLGFIKKLIEGNIMQSENIVISSENYKKLQIHKNLDNFIQ